MLVDANDTSISTPSGTTKSATSHKLAGMRNSLASHCVFIRLRETLGILLLTPAGCCYAVCTCVHWVSQSCLRAPTIAVFQLLTSLIRDVGIYKNGYLLTRLLSLTCQRRCLSQSRSA